MSKSGFWSIKRPVVPMFPREKFQLNIANGIVHASKSQRVILDVLPHLKSSRCLRLDLLLGGESDVARVDHRAHALGGRDGLHTEHMGRLLAEMQVIQRSHPGLEW